MRARPRLSALVSAFAVVTLGGGAMPASATVATAATQTAGPTATPRPPFEMPFTCGETWYGSTRASHSPSPFSIDWNRDENDLGHVVVATQPGLVKSVTDLGDSSYGLYVEINHDPVWSTLYAHLSAAYVVRGEWVDEGQVIGLLGDSGNATGPHLHYEQRRHGDDRHATFDDTRFHYNSWLASLDCPDLPVAGDWNGDGRTDVGTFGHRPSTGAFRERFPSGRHTRTTFGVSTDQPLVGDWDGNARADLGVWRTTKRLFVQRDSAGRRDSFHFGRRGDIAVVGDWNGDGLDDVGVFRPADATFYLRWPNGHVTVERFGKRSSIPVAGDWDGTGRSQVGVYQRRTGEFTVQLSGGETKTVRFGPLASLPVVGSWNADDRTDLGVWNPARGVFSKRLGPDKTLTIRFGRPR